MKETPQTGRGFLRWLSGQWGDDNSRQKSNKKQFPTFDRWEEDAHFLEEKGLSVGLVGVKATMNTGSMMIIPSNRPQDLVQALRYGDFLSSCAPLVCTYSTSILLWMEWWSRPKIHDQLCRMDDERGRQQRRRPRIGGWMLREAQKMNWYFIFQGTLTSFLPWAKGVGLKVSSCWSPQSEQWVTDGWLSRPVMLSFAKPHAHKSLNQLAQS